MAGVIKRIDYKPFSTECFRVVCFCGKCDPTGKGGQGGMLANDIRTVINEKIKSYYSDFIRYCPTCGERIDWDDIKERENYLH